MRIFLLAIALHSCSFLTAQQIAIIPQPASVIVGKGSFTINASTQIKFEGSGLENSANFLNDYLKKIYGFNLATTTKSAQKNVIVLNYERMDNPIAGAYRIDVTGSSVYIAGDNAEGVFYGIQTLIQLLPVELSKSLAIPQVKIEDHPRFAWRGLHLDVSRHFFDVDFIKKYIDFIALHKLNYFHWHLTDDQGWRIEIKKYPKLTETGSCRDGTIIGRYPGKGNDSIRYCGYYTQDQVREVVKYASDRYVTVIPEIEMPGHASAALTSYPYLGCTGGPYHVQQTWGVFSDVFCAGNDSTFQFLQDVIDEVIALFPSKYIHVGGDECPKTAWKKCPKCQKRIHDNNLKDEHELQSYTIRRMEKYINSKGRQIIGWDEILEGGLAPNAAVMSWRGEKGGIAAAKEHHTVVMTPTTYVYLDYAQKRNEDSVVIGGFLPIETVYNYEPLPKELTPEEQKYIFGVQANIWTEYTGNPAKLEYMIFPRASALAEVAWSPKEQRNWSEFEKKLPVQFKRYELWKTNYSKAYYDLKASILPDENNSGLLWKLETKFPNAQIKIDGLGNSSSLYNTPVHVTQNVSLTANCYLQNQLVSSATQNFYLNKATGKKITLTNPPAVEFPGNGGAFGLINGAVSKKYGNFSEWLGWPGGDMEALIDLGKDESLSKINIHTLDQKRGRFYAPSYVEVFVSSNGTDFKSVGKTSSFVVDQDNIGDMTVTFATTAARYIKVFAKNAGTIPEGQPGAGNAARMLIDEIQAE
ncbi:MAG: family 20 glycosylhydrolase [Bacteroidetes bacterium]|nr:family 20 glycosylhydrolase [Bacteroidota bacterium]